MKKFSLLKGAAVGLACLGMALPQTTMAASPVAAPVAAKVQIADVSLTNATLTGKVVNAQGQLLEGSVIKISQGNQEIATTVAGQQGEFAFRNLSTGVYQISTGQTQAAVRLWEGNAAPPTAKKNILLVNGPTTRAQFGSLPRLTTTQMIIIGGVITTAIVVPIVLNNNDDDDPIVSP